jgi:hypothetical protein
MLHLCGYGAKNTHMQHAGALGCVIVQQTIELRPAISRPMEPSPLVTCSSLGCASRGLALLDTHSFCDTYRTHAWFTTTSQRPAQLVLGRN